MQSLPEISVSYSSKQLPENVEDIDKEDSGNPQLVSVYVKDIYVYLRELEVIMLNVFISEAVWDTSNKTCFQISLYIKPLCKTTLYNCEIQKGEGI